MSFDKEQLTKLLIHTLKELGYNDTSITLQRESGGIQIESNLVQSLFKYIKESNYHFITFEFLAQLPLTDITTNKINNSNKTTSENNLYQFCQLHNLFDDGDDETNNNKLKISNIITSTDHLDIIDHFNNQYNIFVTKWDQLYPLIKDNTFIPYSYLIILQIILLFQRQFFIELIINYKDYKLAMDFLRNTITKFQFLLNKLNYPNIGLFPFQAAAAAAAAAETDEEAIEDNNKKSNYNNFLLRQLTNFIINPHSIELKYPTSTTYKDELIDIISKVINPDDLIPSGRLITLLKQSIQYQNSQNGLNIFDEIVDYSKFSLLQDNNKKNFNGYYQFNNINTLNESNGEIWYLQFSPDGKYLVSATSNDESDKKIFIYDVENDFQVYKILAGNIHSSLYLSFSPNGNYLVSCPFNGNTNIYFIHDKGEPITTFNNSNKNNNSRSKSSRSIPEIIYPMDSLEITTDFTLKSYKYGNSMSSPQYNQELESTMTPLRIWCCDWFHTPQHENIIVLGSPDRGVIFYNFDSKQIIYTMSQKSTGHNRYLLESPTNTTTQYNQRMVESFNARTGNDNHYAEGGGINMDGTSMETTIDNTKFPHVHGLKISNDDKYLIVMSNEKFIDVYDITNFPTNDQLSRDNNSALESFIPPKISQLVLDDNIKLTCISLPEPSDLDLLKSNYPTDPKLLEHLILVNANPNRLELWNYKENILMQKFVGQKQEQYIIRSCFGYNNKIVISGSEDGRIYIWDKLNGRLLNVLPGHLQPNNLPAITPQIISPNKKKEVSTNCNIVAWSPTDKNLFVSGGDDGLVKVWRIAYDN